MIKRVRAYGTHPTGGSLRFLNKGRLNSFQTAFGFLYHQAFFTNSDFKFMALPSILQAIS